MAAGLRVRRHTIRRIAASARASEDLEVQPRRQRRITRDERAHAGDADEQWAVHRAGVTPPWTHSGEEWIRGIVRRHSQVRFA